MNENGISSAQMRADLRGGATDQTAAETQKWLREVRQKSCRIGIPARLPGDQMFRSRYAGHPVLGRATHAGRRSHPYLSSGRSGAQFACSARGMGLPCHHTALVPRESRPRMAAKLRWRARALFWCVPGTAECDRRGWSQGRPSPIGDSQPGPAHLGGWQQHAISLAFSRASSE
jgi:hypothetical protein